MGLLGLIRATGSDVTAPGPAPGSRAGLAVAVEAGRSPGRLLVVVLRDAEAAERALLDGAAAAGVRVLVLVDDPAELGRVAGAGCGGFVLSSQLDAAPLVYAFDQIRAGHVLMPPVVAHHLMASVQVDGGSGVRLTSREQQTLILLVDSLSNKQIAKQLGVSGHGAQRLAANVLAKLDCTNRTAAVARARDPDRDRTSDRDGDAVEPGERRRAALRFRGRVTPQHRDRHVLTDPPRARVRSSASDPNSSGCVISS